MQLCKPGDQAPNSTVIFFLPLVLGYPLPSLAVLSAWSGPSTSHPLSTGSYCYFASRSTTLRSNWLEVV